MGVGLGPIELSVISMVTFIIPVAMLALTIWLGVRFVRAVERLAAAAEVMARDKAR